MARKRRRTRRSSRFSAVPRSFGGKRRRSGRRRSGGGGGGMGFLSKYMPPAAIISTVGAFGSLFAIDKVFSFLTKDGTVVPDWLKTNYARAGVKLAVGAVGYTIGKRYNHAAATGFFIGCGFAAALDLYNQFSPPPANTPPHGVHGFDGMAAFAAGPGPGVNIPSQGPDYNGNLYDGVDADQYQNS